MNKVKALGIATLFTVAGAVVGRFAPTYGLENTTQINNPTAKEHYNMAAMQVGAGAGLALGLVFLGIRRHEEQEAKRSSSGPAHPQR